MKRLFARRSSRWPIAIDIALLGVALALFTAAILPNLSASTYFDEGYSAFLAKLDILSMAGYTALDVHPPLYYAALHVWQAVFGWHVESLRFMSVVFGWIALIFGFLLVRRWFSRQAAWLAALLMAISPLFVRYGGTMRMYTMALAIAFAATYVLLRATHSKSKKWWIVYAVLVAAGMWTNYFTALVWVTHLLWVLYEYRGHSIVAKRWVRAVALAVLLYLPWLPWLLLRYGDIQANGFWIKPLSINTLTSTVTQSLVFRTAADTTNWLVVAVIVLIVAVAIAGRSAYSRLDKKQLPAFRLVLAMSSLPVVLLALMSLPPLRPSYTYRYALVAAVTCCALMGIIIATARFRQHDATKRGMLAVLAIALLGLGTSQVIALGNRNLDTNFENKIGQVIRDVQHSGISATMVVRSPYTYYAASLYSTTTHPIYVLYGANLASVGSTKPLYDHSEYSIKNFDSLSSVWLVGEDKNAVTEPKKGEWTEKKRYTEYDDVTKKPIAFAAYYERIAK